MARFLRRFQVNSEIPQLSLGILGDPRNLYYFLGISTISLEFVLVPMKMCFFMWNPWGSSRIAKKPSALTSPGRRAEAGQVATRPRHKATKSPGPSGLSSEAPFQPRFFILAHTFPHFLPLSQTFSNRLWPSLTFSDLLQPSPTFSNLLQPSPTFSNLL